MPTGCNYNMFASETLKTIVKRIILPGLQPTVILVKLIVVYGEVVEAGQGRTVAGLLALRDVLAVFVPFFGGSQRASQTLPAPEETLHQN